VSSGVRLAELLAGLSLATDLGFGQPPEHIVRSTRIALRIAARLDLSNEELASVYDVGLLTYVGCPVYGNAVAGVFGDDIEFRAGVHSVDLAGLPAMAYMMRRAGHGTSIGNRLKQRATLALTGGRGLVEVMADHCAAAGELASGLGLSSSVQRSLEQVYARWDGRGVPHGIGGEQLELAGRVALVAEMCEVMTRRLGIDRAVEVVRTRSGTQFDPQIVSVVAADPRSLLGDIDTESLEEVLDSEPVARGSMSDDELDDALAAIGDFCDLRCPYFAGHARGTAELAERAGALLHVGLEELPVLRRAALVHDVGRFGVPGSVWDRPGPLSAHDQERMRFHVYLVERMFSRPEPLRRIGRLAGTHHERMDGSGYHRGASGVMLSTAARVLAAADSYHAMTQERPHRRALTPDDAARELRCEADAGRIDPIVVDVVLTATGQAPTTTRSGGPAGLTARETDVLRLLALGRPNKAIARELAISPKTVSNHIQHIYAKLGVRNRATAALLAMRHGVVDTLSPYP
jgi:HD-GYP domain-containing protein (c-di-GMP phosphodiesterase class II)